ncbi:hypothetical protein H634G_11128 [Metarhizium anisopliae BRIP 53293]|uniref:Uncharacterized protein n=1 Tax=Metarhizium anisopliae BRIP 53293 TaxID=1291518 RepID=A0A0D9NI31_METAN|nr:hypothetical protein H634G_11128 [Metarhizium anisopliae BRIP 53293]KJK85284.1 hypothetical protein H633G_10880 [Metarhizium anisopliae BRIP 53284]
MAVVQTVVVPGPTATLTQITVINKTQILTSRNIITLPTIQLTKRVTSFATIVGMPQAITPPYPSIADTSKRTDPLSSAPRPRSTENSLLLPSGSALDNGWTNTTSGVAISSDRPNLVTGLTTLYQSQPPTLPIGIGTDTPIQDESTPTVMEITTPTKEHLGEIQVYPPGGIRYSPNEKVPAMSGPPPKLESAAVVNSPSSFEPVISQGSLIYLPAMLWSATIASVVLGIMWGAA